MCVVHTCTEISMLAHTHTEMRVKRSNLSGLCVAAQNARRNFRSPAGTQTAGRGYRDSVTFEQARWWITTTKTLSHIHTHTHCGCYAVRWFTPDRTYIGRSTLDAFAYSKYALHLMRTELLYNILYIVACILYRYSGVTNRLVPS